MVRTRVFSWMVIPAEAAIRCGHCKDNVLPSHAPDVCPLVGGAIENAAALVAATGVVISVSNLLPLKVIRALPRTALDAIKAQVQRPQGVFDFHGKSIKEVFQAAVSICNV